MMPAEFLGSAYLPISILNILNYIIMCIWTMFAHFLPVHKELGVENLFFFIVR